MDKNIYGISTDPMGRCVHYHQDNDIAGLKCEFCQQYFACYKCHNDLKNHKFVTSDKNCFPVICGNCQNVLNFDQYTLGQCLYCHHDFNKNCALHYNLYFK